MGFRIIDRRNQIVLRRMEQLRQALLEQEAERFVSRRGQDDAESKKAFIEKLNNVKFSTPTALALVERLEESLKTDKNQKAPPFLGPIEPGDILDLL